MIILLKLYVCVIFLLNLQRRFVFVYHVSVRRASQNLYLQKGRDLDPKYASTTNDIYGWCNGHAEVTNHRHNNKLVTPTAASKRLTYQRRVYNTDVRLHQYETRSKSNQSCLLDECQRDSVMATGLVSKKSSWNITTKRNGNVNELYPASIFQDATDAAVES